MTDTEKKLPSVPLRDLSDAERRCEDVIDQVHRGILDAKTADTMLKAIKTFAEIYVSRLKNDPKNEAQKEYARGVARKAVEGIDIDKAREMLLNRNFTHLEDRMGVIDVEAQAVEAEAKLKTINRKQL